MTPYGPAVFMESLNNIGFDEINVIDTTTGQLNYISANLMERSILLACADPLDCDELRNSVWVPDSNSFYFQVITTTNTNIYNDHIIITVIIN